MNNPFQSIDEKLNKIESLLLQLKQLPHEKLNQNKDEEFLTVKETAEFLSLSVPTIYGLIHKGEIPVMKRSKRCYFSKIELINYLKLGKRKTLNEIEKEADRFISQKKGGKTC